MRLEDGVFDVCDDNGDLLLDVAGKAPGVVAVKIHIP